MLQDLTIEMRWLLCALAVWRITHLLVAEDGPGDIVFRLRKKLGNSGMGRAMDCFYCTSVWISVPFSFLVSPDWTTRALCWISISGAACLLEQLTGNQNKK